MSATIVAGRNRSANLANLANLENLENLENLANLANLEFALDGVSQGHAELPFSMSAAGGLLGCATACCNGTVPALRGA